MMKTLHGFKWWIVAGLLCAVWVPFMAYQQHRASERYRDNRALYCAAFMMTEQQKIACEEEKASADDYLPWGYKLFKWPEGITAWAIILTGFAIAWQGDQTRRAAVATERSVAVARRQNDMMKDRERARIEIKPGTLLLEDEASPYWNLVGDVKVRNLGSSRAYINQFQMDIIWCDSDTPPLSPDFSVRNNILEESFIDPTEDSDDPILPRTHFFDTAKINLEWFAAAIYEGRIKVFMRGICEYETVGTEYGKYVAFEWRPSSSGLMSSLYNNTPPTTNSDKIRSGYWNTMMERELDRGPKDHRPEEHRQPI